MGVCFGGTCGKEPACRCRRPKRHGFDTWVGRSPGGGHDNPLQHFFLENPMDRGAWWATVHKVAKSWTRLKWLSTHTWDLGPLDKTGWDSLAGRDRSLATSRLDWIQGEEVLGYQTGLLCQGSLEPVPALVRGHYLGRRTTGTTLLSALIPPQSLPC